MATKKKPVEHTQWVPPNLKGTVAVVTGSSRGAGRGIALVLGECGATVYVTGRSVRGGPAFGRGPGTIDDTADEVTARGGRGIAVRCDHTRDEEVKSLFERVGKEQGRLDLLVNNAWGGYEGGLTPAYFWKAPLNLWEKMFVAGLKAHLVASYCAIPLMLPAPSQAGPQKRGLLVSTVAWDRNKYIGSFYDISKHAIVRMIYGLGIELRPFGITAVAVAPGFMRTEAVLQAYKVSEENWQKVPQLKQTHSPEYLGRIVARLAVDPKLMRRSGQVFRAGELARVYRLRDIDGRSVPPFTVPPFEKVVRMFKVSP